MDLKAIYDIVREELKKSKNVEEVRGKWDYLWDSLTSVFYEAMADTIAELEWAEEELEQPNVEEKGDDEDENDL